jgi:hypothetical protein
MNNLLSNILDQQAKILRILEIGRRTHNWRDFSISGGAQIHLTVLKTEAFFFTGSKSNSGYFYLHRFADKHFDLVFTRDLEHFSSFDNQLKIAKEIQRVGKQYCVLTPNKWFPIEPNWRFPFFYFLPYSIKVYLTWKFNLGTFKKAPSLVQARRRVMRVRLLEIKELKKLFPGAGIHRERRLLMTKKFIVTKGNL